MANTRDIRLRIKGVKSTRQITRAMQMVATSKMKKAQDAAKNGRPYAMLLADVIVSVADEFEEITHKYFNDRPVRHRGILVIGTDKGLCGALNSNLFRMLSDVDSSAKFVAVGKRGPFIANKGGKVPWFIRFFSSINCILPCFAISLSTGYRHNGL